MSLSVGCLCLCAWKRIVLALWRAPPSLSLSEVFSCRKSVALAPKPRRWLLLQQRQRERRSEPTCGACDAEGCVRGGVRVLFAHV